MNTRKKLSNTMKLLGNIDKFGTVGLFLTALFSPCCFPLFTFGASAFGFGSFELFGGWTMWIFQAMVLISIGGLYFSYRRHRFVYPLTVGIISGLLVFYGYFFNDSDYWTYFLYLGMFGLLLATIWNYQRNKINGTCNTCTINNDRLVELQSTIICPKCGQKKTEIMPTDACVYFYECDNCKTRIKPLQGDCCVYCSYGSVKCPPIQSGENCC